MLGDKSPPTARENNEDPHTKLGTLILKPGATDAILFLKFYECK